MAEVIATDVLKMRKVIKFQSSWIAIYYKIRFGVLLQLTCAGEISVIAVIDKQYNLVPNFKGNTMVQKPNKTKNVQLSLFFTVKI